LHSASQLFLIYENVGCVFSRDDADVGEPKLSGQFFRETSQLPLIQKLAIDHSYNQLLHTALQPLDLDRETEESSWREALQKLKARGVEFIKVHNALSQEAFFALADEVHKQGLPLCRALAQRDKSCGSFRRRLFARFVKNGTWYVPTLIIIGGFFPGATMQAT
jgi:hypothetical protein